MSTRTRPLDARAMNAMAPERFEELVNRWTRDELDQRSTTILLGPEVIERTHLALESILASVNGQIAARTSDQEAARTHFEQAEDDFKWDVRQLEERFERADMDPDERALRLSQRGAEFEEIRRAWRDENARFETWRGRTIRFRTGIEQDMFEVRRLRDRARLTVSPVLKAAERLLAAYDDYLETDILDGLAEATGHLREAVRTAGGTAA